MAKRNKKEWVRFFLKVLMAMFAPLAVGEIVAPIFSKNLTEGWRSLFSVVWVCGVILAAMSWLLLKSMNDLRKKLEPSPVEELPIDLHVSNAGMSCDDFTLLFVAGPWPMPSVTAQRMRVHKKDCEYHRSTLFLQSAIGMPVTPELEKEALELIATMNK